MSLDKRNLKVLTTGPPGNQGIKRELIEKFDGQQDMKSRQDFYQRPVGPAGTHKFSGLHDSNPPSRNVRTEPPFGSNEDIQHPREEKKFTGRCRLFVGNLSAEVTEDEFKEWFKPFGEFTEVFLNSQKSFGFIRMDTRAHAEAARVALDGVLKKGRNIRVRFASLGAAIKLHYLPNYASNELLEKAFESFGEVEYAVVVVDDRGKATGDGIIEFARKPSALQALKRIQEGVFLLSSTPRPIMAEALDQKDELGGLPEKFIIRTPEMAKDREQPPRFASPGTFEYDVGLKWKELYKKRIESEEAIKRQFDEEVKRMELEMSHFQMEHQASLMRQDLLRRQEELRRLEEQQQLEMTRRMEMNRRMEEERRREEEKRQDMMVRDQMLSFDMMGPPRDLMSLGQRDLRLGVDHRDMPERMRGDRNMPPPMQPPPVPPAGMPVGERNRMTGSMNMPPPNLMSVNNINMNPGGQPPVIEPLVPGLPMRQPRFEQNAPMSANVGGDMGMPPPLFDNGMMGPNNGRMGGGGGGPRDRGVGYSVGRGGGRDRPMPRDDFKGSFGAEKRQRRF